MKNNMHEWYLAKDKLPKENEAILFQPYENAQIMNVIYLGEYIKSENMFYIGIEDSGDFLFAFDVYKWCYLSDYVEQLNSSKKGAKSGVKLSENVEQLNPKK